MDWLRLRRAATIGWCFGFGYFVAGWYWIGEAFLVEADKFACSCRLPSPGWRVDRRFYAIGRGRGSLLAAGSPGVLVLALTISAAEWLRGHLLTGFPWNCSAMR